MALKRSTKMRNKLLDSQSFKALMDGGLLVLYSGQQPSSPNDPIGESDRALMKVTVGAQDYDPATTGLNFATSAVDGYITKDGDTWQGEGIVDGQAGYFRFYSNVDGEAEAVDTATSNADGTTTDYATVTANKACFDGTCGVTGDLQMVSTSVVKAAISTIDQFKLTLPE